MAIDENEERRLLEEVLRENRPKPVGWPQWFYETAYFLYEFVISVLLALSIMALVALSVFHLLKVLVYRPLMYLSQDPNHWIQLLLSINPLQLLSVRVGCVTVFFSPLSLCPWILPNWFPFKNAYLGVTLMDSPVTWPSLFLNLHIYPSAFVYLPPLFSLHRLSAYTVSLTLVSASVVGFPLELICLRLYLSLWSLFTGAFSEARIGPVLLPVIKSVTPSADLEPHSGQISVQVIEPALNIVEPEPLIADQWFGGVFSMMSSYSFLTTTLWFLVSRNTRI